MAKIYHNSNATPPVSRTGHASLVMISDLRSKTPVPLLLGAPMTMLAEGLRRSSKSPWSVASDKKAAVVSKDAFSSGDDFVAIPVRLNGL